MPGIYRARHLERTVLYRVLFHYFERFLTEYERRFEKDYGYFRPVIKEVVERYLDCGNPCSGFALIRCPNCHLSQTVRVQFGLSVPLVDKANSGLSNPMFILGFQFGK